MESDKISDKVSDKESDKDNSDIENIEARLDLDRLAQSASEAELSSASEDEDDDAEDDTTVFEEGNTVYEDAREAPESGDEQDILESESDVPLSEAEIDSEADVVPHTKLSINNTAALENALQRIKLPWAKCTFEEHQSVTSKEATETKIKDIYDDTQRELAFYQQALEATLEARGKLISLKVPFSRPLDYFAEMVKSDEHMDQLRTRLVQDAAAKKASQDAKKQRQLKKFGKQVQNETLQNRAKERKNTLEKIKTLKRKRQDNEMDQDEFSIAVEEAAADKQDRKRTKPNGKRLAKDKKFGFGGKKKRSKENDATSSADVTGFNGRKMKQQSQRPGKSRRRKN